MDSLIVINSLWVCRKGEVSSDQIRNSITSTVTCWTGVANEV